MAHSRGGFKGHEKQPLSLFSSLHWAFQMDLTTSRQHHAPAPVQTTVPDSQSIMVTYTCSESGVLTCPCPWEVASLHCGARGTSQGSRRGALPSKLFSCTPQLYFATLGE